jgi:hypothetical protein
LRELWLSGVEENLQGAAMYPGIRGEKITQMQVYIEEASEMKR